MAPQPKPTRSVNVVEHIDHIDRSMLETKIRDLERKISAIERDIAEANDTDSLLAVRHKLCTVRRLSTKLHVQLARTVFDASDFTLDLMKSRVFMALNTVRRLINLYTRLYRMFVKETRKRDEFDKAIDVFCDNFMGVIIN